MYTNLPPSVLLKQVRLLEPVAQIDQVTDILIIEGQIQSINPKIENIPAQVVQVKAENWLLAPALVDLYSMLSEPGHEERETFSSLLKAAQVGGIACLNLLANTSPAVDNPAPVSLLSQRLKAEQVPLTVNFWGGITIALAGKQMSDLIELAQAGIIGFTDSHSLQDLGLVRRVLEYLKPVGLPIALTALDRSLEGKGVMRDGIDSIRLGLTGVPVYAETAPLAALLQLVEEIGTPVHFMRISTAKGVDLIAEAKKKGLPITASTTWMHLVVSSEAIASYNTNFRLQPPLGNPEDRKALIQALKTGVLDAIAIDHTPYTYEEKTVSFAEAPPGVIGLEIALPLLWHSLVSQGPLSALEFWKTVTINPLNCLGRSSSVKDWILFNPNQSWKVEPNTLSSLSSNTPWLGQEIFGRVVQTFYNTSLPNL